jgi:plastocyanin
MRRWGLAAVAVLAASGTAAQVPVDKDTQEVCAEAEQRFAAQGGKKDPGVVMVLMYKYRFCPPNVTVKVGATVRWINVDKRTSHSVWLKEAGKEESPRIFNFETYEFSFTTPGKYPYLCGPHWEQEKMIGHVTVAP